MRRVLRAIVLLYPGAWRRRYARELDALFDDFDPGWRDAVDVLHGALHMRLRSLGTLPVAGLLLGIVAGGASAWSTPPLYAAFGTIRVSPDGLPDGSRAATRSVRTTLEDSLAGVLGGSRDARVATSVELVDRTAERVTLKVTYMHGDPMRAQQVAAQLLGAISKDREAGAAPAILTAPSLPEAPMQPEYAPRTAAGGLIGLMAGAMAFLGAQARQRRRR
jgi:hypothetical protein